MLLAYSVIVFGMLYLMTLNAYKEVGCEVQDIVANARRCNEIFDQSRNKAAMRYGVEYNI